MIKCVLAQGCKNRWQSKTTQSNVNSTKADIPTISLVGYTNAGKIYAIQFHH
ncbi:MAG: hypothetical protein ACLR5N_04710 [Haemophilus parainfluenzae]